ncbi:peptidoglycan DD-metalloendopeptidase family protein [Gryllotalpicola koreensis]|uniref:M23ase beta-sheet core domain-containing protein n=1 Tax=Gryllotalpicola koreensis TaxID=993086 RepID=A0ABP7ZV32_9MICO
MLTAKLAAGAALAAALVLAPARAAGTDATAAGPHWRWPTSPPGAIIEPFVAPPGPYAAGHRGLDVAASPGQSVLAPTSAVVQFSGVVVDRPVVTLRVDEHVLVSFEPVATELAVGTPVAAAQQFGVAARGGHCDERCIHVGVRVDGEYVSPLAYFAGIPPAVLLPLN